MKTETKKFTKTELILKIKSLGKIDDNAKKKIICVLIGHSSIVSTCFGYVHCGRCEEQIGDQLGGMFDTKEKVIIGHNCSKCKKNFKKLTWRDKYLVPNPFKKKQL